MDEPVFEVHIKFVLMTDVQGQPVREDMLNIQDSIILGHVIYKGVMCKVSERRSCRTCNEAWGAICLGLPCELGKN